MGYIFFKRYLNVKEKALESERARLDDFRAHLDRTLAEMNYKFSSSEARWRELNHLVVAGQGDRKQLQSTNLLQLQKSDFLSSHGIDTDNVKIRPDLIFVITPFHEDLYDEFQSIVKIGSETGFIVNRGDERASQGEIFPQLLKLIIEARIIIANISGRNPNVFYELGIAHALDKTVILVAHRSSEVPFDIRAKRIIFYENESDLAIQLKKMLVRVLADEGRII